MLLINALMNTGTHACIIVIVHLYSSNSSENPQIRPHNTGPRSKRTISKRLWIYINIHYLYYMDKHIHYTLLLYYTCMHSFAYIHMNTSHYRGLKTIVYLNLTLLTGQMQKPSHRNFN